MNPSRSTAGRRHPAVLDASLMMLGLLGVAAAYRAAAGSVPVATAGVVAVSTAGGMHARLAMGRWRAAAQILACASLVTVLGAAPRLVGAVLISGLIGAELIARCSGRSAVLQASAWTGVAAGLVSLSGVAAAVPLPPGLALREGLAAVVGGILSAPLMLVWGPVAERLFGHTTRLTMAEWLSYDHPLLRQLASAAPGTFQHSVNVGVLADAAAGAVGGDALLARVGGLYHDTGKSRAPEYFIENQHGPNPHDSLNPWDSARILRSHVTDGVQLVRTHHMGDRIADFVREHHGTGAMRLLRDKAANAGAAPADETYRYAGPRPRSRETGIVMIADQVEATARSAPPVDDAACDDIVRRTLERIQGEGQLDDSGLTPQELSAVQPALSRALQAMYHRRLTYPPSESRPSGRFGFVQRALARRRT